MKKQKDRWEEIEVKPVPGPSRWERIAVITLLLFTAFSCYGLWLASCKVGSLLVSLARRAFS